VIRSRISFPEPGYVATSRIVVACALSLLLERAIDGKGGIFTSAVAFETTQLRQRLERRGICFEVLIVVACCELYVNSSSRLGEWEF